MPLFMPGSKNYINVKDPAYGAVMDGSHDDSAAFTAAYQTASTANLPLYVPGGTLIKGNDTILPGVMIVGAGIGVTTIKLKAGANTDLFSAYTSSINLSASSGSGSTTGVVGFGFYGLTLDGNKANQTSGTSYPIRVYGYACMIQDLEVTNGYTGGILSDWNGTSDPTSGLTICNHWRDVQVHRNNGIGIEIGGPTDSKWFAVDSFHNGSHNYHFAPNAVGYTISNCHGWSAPTGISAVSFLCEAAGTFFTNCQMEGSDTVQVVLLGNDSVYVGGEIFNATTFVGGASAVGVQIGQLAGRTPYAGQIYQSANLTTLVHDTGVKIDTKFSNVPGGAIDYQSEANSDVTAVVWTNGGNVLASGRTPNYTSRVIVNVTGTASDTSQNTTNQFTHTTAGATGFRVLAASDGTPLLSANGTTKVSSFQNGTQFRGYSGFGSGQTFNIDSVTGNITTIGSAQIQASSTFYSGSGAPSGGVGVNGDFYFRDDTPGTANQRVYVKSAGTWTGIV